MTWTRPELSEKNKYRISKHRHYELKHFCLQYPGWKKAYHSLERSGVSSSYFTGVKTGGISDLTAKYAIDMAYYSERMKLVEEAAKEADPDLADYILRGATDGLTFEQLKTRLDIPCSRSTYYDRYRKFFYILDKTRE